MKKIAMIGFVDEDSHDNGGRNALRLGFPERREA